MISNSTSEPEKKLDNQTEPFKAPTSSFPDLAPPANVQDKAAATNKCFKCIADFCCCCCGNRRSESNSELSKQLPNPAKIETKLTPKQVFEQKLMNLKGALMPLAYLYLSYQVILVVCLTVYYYYELDMYLPVAFGITVFICYLRSWTAFISLKLAHRNSKDWANKNWKELRDWFYWSVALMIIGLVILMGIVPLRVSQLVNINLLNLLIINGVDFALFATMGVISIIYCHNIIEGKPQQV